MGRRRHCVSRLACYVQSYKKHEESQEVSGVGSARLRWMGKLNAMSQYSNEPLQQVLGWKLSITIIRERYSAQKTMEPMYEVPEVRGRESCLMNRAAARNQPIALFQNQCRWYNDVYRTMFIGQLPEINLYDMISALVSVRLE